jgi:hypothetical protein
MTNRSKNDLDFVGKSWQNFEIEHDDHVIILLMMRHGFIIDRLVGSQAMLFRLVEMNHRGPLFVEIGLNLEQCFIYSLNQVVLLLYIR